MKLKALLGAGVVAGSMLFSTIAGAAVTFDAQTGTGFVGKGDVQTVFALNNKQMQVVHDAVAFAYSSTDTYDAVCSFTTGEGTRGEKLHNVEHERSTSVAGVVASESKKTGQWTGWHLVGFGATTTTGGAVPVVGEACPGNQGHEGIWSSVELTGSSVGGLTATIGGVTLPIAITPVV